MRKYLVWEPEEGETVEDALLIESFSAAMAAEEHVENVYGYVDDEYFPMVVCVQLADGTTMKFRVEIEYAPSFQAELIED